MQAWHDVKLVSLQSAPLLISIVSVTERIISIVLFRIVAIDEVLKRIINGIFFISEMTGNARK